MNEDPQSPGKSLRTWILYGVIGIIALLFLSFFIESCDAEKIRICDDATGECTLESSCRPLLFDFFR
ncbi:MAG: hypothetical protein QOE22_282 [Candidatus Parcubacteria bacterium]|jgi:hypothetical protein|nr:hypothetical protein [Candidatus Parcubacteria bacterium]